MDNLIKLLYLIQNERFDVLKEHYPDWSGWISDLEAEMYVSDGYLICAADFLEDSILEIGKSLGYKTPHIKEEINRQIGFVRKDSENQGVYILRNIINGKTGNDAFNGGQISAIRQSEENKSNEGEKFIEDEDDDRSDWYKKKYLSIETQIFYIYLLKFNNEMDLSVPFLCREMGCGRGELDKMISDLVAAKLIIKNQDVNNSDFLLKAEYRLVFPKESYKKVYEKFLGKQFEAKELTDTSKEEDIHAAQIIANIKHMDTGDIELYHAIKPYHDKGLSIRDIVAKTGIKKGKVEEILKGRYFEDKIKDVSPGVEGNKHFRQLVETVGIDDPEKRDEVQKSIVKPGSDINRSDIKKIKNNTKP